MSLLDQGHSDHWRKALGAVDALRDRFGETSVTLASSMKGRFRERVHENPVGLPGKGKKPQDLD
jgi:DNA polymerase-4